MKYSSFELTITVKQFSSFFLDQMTAESYSHNMGHVGQCVFANDTISLFHLICVSKIL